MYKAECIREPREAWSEEAVPHSWANCSSIRAATRLREFFPASLTSGALARLCCLPRDPSSGADIPHAAYYMLDAQGQISWGTGNRN